VRSSKYLYIRDDVGLGDAAGCINELATLGELEAELKGSGAEFLEPRSLYDTAIVGIAEQANGARVVAYDCERVVRALAEQDGWDEKTAREWYAFNIAGAFVGPGTPVFIESFDDQ
jgi:hypothetical protein